MHDFSRIVEKGHSSIVLTPELHPSSMVTKLMETIQSNYNWIELENFGESVVKAIGDALPCFFENKIFSLSFFRTVAEEITEKCFFLDCRKISPTQWDTVREFLDVFQTIMKDMEPYDRSIILIMAPHYCFLDAMKTDVTCESLVWSNYVRPRDIYYMQEIIEKSDSCHSIEKELRNEVISQLCLWDESLLLEFKHLDLRAVLSPAQLMGKYAERMNWDKYSSDSIENLKLSGIVQCVENCFEIHTAFGYKYAKDHVLQKRLWAAEVRTLFPYIQVQREKIISGYGYFISLPYMNPKTSEIITDLLDLEIGTLAYLFLRHGEGTIPKRIIEFTCWLRDIRNFLAHRKVVEYDFLKRFIDKEPFE